MRFTPLPSAGMIVFRPRHAVLSDSLRDLLDLAIQAFSAFVDVDDFVDQSVAVLAIAFTKKRPDLHTGYVSKKNNSCQLRKPIVVRVPLFSDAGQARKCQPFRNLYRHFAPFCGWKSNTVLFGCQLNGYIFWLVIK